MDIVFLHYIPELQIYKGSELLKLVGVANSSLAEAKFWKSANLFINWDVILLQPLLITRLLDHLHVYMEMKYDV